MKESKFVGQNKEIWLKFESDLRNGQNKAQLSNLFTHITDDLSYARTFYKFRLVKVYLNGIAQILFNTIYRNQSGTLSSFLQFWKVDLPMQVHSARKEFRVSFLIFLLAFGIGMLSSIYDKDFARSILGDSYVNMTVENIKNHDPLAVYKKGNEASMFLGITINNLSVSLITFVFGAFMSVGTILALIRNGVMVGVFQYFFIERGLFKESFLTIWQHGTIEISCIIIAGAAGLTLGKGLIFPGTYSRMQSFKLSARRGLKIFTGITPLIILAAFIEGFITRHTEVNMVVRITVICLSLGFILFYFGWYPWYVSRNNRNDSVLTEKIQYEEPWRYDFSKILTANETLGYSFKFFNQNSLYCFYLVFGMAVFHAAGTFLYELKNIDLIGYNKHSIETFHQMNSIGVHFWLGILTLSLLQFVLNLRMRKLLDKGAPKLKQYINLGVSSLIASSIILLPFYFGFLWGVASVILLSPYLFLAVYHSFMEGVLLLSILGRTFSLLEKSWEKLLWNSIKLFGFVLLIYFLLNTEMGWQIIESIYINFNSNPETSRILELVVLALITMGMFGIYFFFQIATSIFSYYAFKETVFADNLNSRIDMFGERSILFGFEKEK